MKSFAALFYRGEEGGSFEIWDLQEGGCWLLVTTGRLGCPPGTVMYAVLCDYGDGDFEGQADSLEEFITDNVEKFL